MVLQQPSLLRGHTNTQQDDLISLLIFFFKIRKSILKISPPLPPPSAWGRAKPSSEVKSTQSKMWARKRGARVSSDLAIFIVCLVEL
jgi:hypothetical protein